MWIDVRFSHSVLRTLIQGFCQSSWEKVITYQKTHIPSTENQIPGLCDGGKLLALHQTCTVSVLNLDTITTVIYFKLCKFGEKLVENAWRNSVKIDFCLWSWWFVMITDWRSKFIQPYITPDIYSSLLVCILIYVTKHDVCLPILITSWGSRVTPLSLVKLTLTQSQHANNTPDLHVWLCVSLPTPIILLLKILVLLSITYSLCCS